MQASAYATPPSPNSPLFLPVAASLLPACLMSSAVVLRLPACDLSDLLMCCSSYLPSPATTWPELSKKIIGAKNCLKKPTSRNPSASSYMSAHPCMCNPMKSLVSSMRVGRGYTEYVYTVSTSPSIPCQEVNYPGTAHASNLPGADIWTQSAPWKPCQKQQTVSIKTPANRTCSTAHLHVSQCAK
jgi:hypothetical protein